MTDVGMEYATLGRTVLGVSRLCLGCMNFGSGHPWMVDNHEAARAVIDRATEAGVSSSTPRTPTPTARASGFSATSSPRRKA